MAGLMPYQRNLVAGQAQTINARGSLLVLRDSSGIVNFKVRDKNGQSYTLSLNRGEQWGTATEFVELQASSDTNQTVQILAGYGSFVQPPPNILSSRSIRSNTIFSASADPVLVSASDSGRHRIHIQLDVEQSVDNTTVRFGDSTISDSEGMLLSQGDSFTLETQDAVYVVLASGNDWTVHILEETTVYGVG